MTDPDFTGQIVLGRNLFTCRTYAVDVMRVQKQISIESMMTTTFETDTGQFEYEALLDTGAGPSLMSEQIWQEISGGAPLQPTTVSLRAANDISMGVVGRTPMLTSIIAGVKVVQSFLVARDLAQIKLVFGRDFVHAHDVLIDLPKGKIVIRNPDGMYLSLIHI